MHVVHLDLVNMTELEWGKKGDFECGMVVGSKWADLSISETADLPGFFPHNHVQGLQRSVQERENIQWASVLWQKMLC